MKNTKKPAKKAAPPRHIPGTATLKEIAAALGITERRVSTLKSDGMRCESVAAALEWRSARESGGGDDESVSALRRERIGLVRAQRERAEIENALSRNELISRQECRAKWAQIGTAVGRLCQAAAREIPQAVLGLPISQSLPKAKELMNAIQRKLADAESEFWQEHKES